MNDLSHAMNSLGYKNPSQPIQPHEVTSKNCRYRCAGDNSRYSLVDSQGLCLCGDSDLDEADKKPDEACDGQCPGDNTLTCGAQDMSGVPLVSLYRTRSTSQNGKFCTSLHSCTIHIAVHVNIH